MMTIDELRTLCRVAQREENPLRRPLRPREHEMLSLVLKLVSVYDAALAVEKDAEYDADGLYYAVGESAFQPLSEALDEVRHV